MFHREWNTVARWTRSDGFRAVYPSINTVGEIRAEEKSSLAPLEAWLQFCEYDGENPPKALRSTRLNLAVAPADLDLKSWILQAVRKEEWNIFHNVKRGRYWELRVKAKPDEMARIAAQAKPPSGIRAMPLSQRIALLLLSSGPLSTRQLAFGLSATVPQVRGAAGLLVSKQLVKKGVEPLTPVSEERLYDWLQRRVLSIREYGDNGELISPMSNPGSLNRWAVELVNKPWLLSDRRKAFRETITAPRRTPHSK